MTSGSLQGAPRGPDVVWLVASSPGRLVAEGRGAPWNANTARPGPHPWNKPVNAHHPRDTARAIGHLTLLVIALSVVLLGCTPGPGTSEVTRALATQTAIASLEAPAAATTPPVPALPPEVEAAMTADLSARHGVSPGAFAIVSVQAALWPDGCLGLAPAGGVCSQALVSGWLAVFRGPGGEEYRYRGAGSRFEREP